MWELSRANGAKRSFALTSPHGDYEEVAMRDAIARLKILAISGGLSWKKQKLICDLLSPYFLELSALKEGDEVLVEASIIRGTSKTSLQKCVELFPAPMPIALLPPFLYFVDADLRLMQKFLSGSALFSHAEWEEVKRDCDENVAIVEEGESGPLLSLPKLILQDETGAFGKTDAKEWENDLLEVGYRKAAEKFYCPSDCARLAISKLLQKGWEVEDARGRKVLLQSGVSYTRSDEGVRGKAHFGEEERDFSDLEMKMQSPLISLSETSVGLLDREELPQEFMGRKAALSNVEAASIGFKGIDPGEVSPGQYFIGELFPYQQQGVNWLHLIYANGLSGILADEMGLGKSVQLLAFFSGLNVPHSLLIVAPTSLLENWQREVQKFWPNGNPYLYYGEGRDPSKLNNQTLVLTSYAILRRDCEELSKEKWGAIALDEAQVIKNPKSQTFQAVLKLQAPFRLSITGTPIENHLQDLFTQFRFLFPKNRFTQTERTKPFILRRTKEEVELDLPEKLEQIVYVGMNEEQQSAYDAMLEKTRQEEDLTQIQVLERLLRLRQICCDPRLIEPENKQSAKFERLLADLEELEGKKVLVYSQFTQMLSLIAKELDKRGKKILYLDGKTKNRMELVDQFQNDSSCNIFLISLKAGGVGLNLTAADYILIYDPWWNEAVENQAIDRAHRIGRKGTVIARRYVTIGSLEEKIMQLKERKRLLVEQSLSSESVQFEELKNLLS
ncbi:MAG: DEAD/DEAH box helicase [Candidatus Algichlamydia australiensis]|nr:DEAD/DEAH box helicase [Chlamydiales bacterium]